MKLFHKKQPDLTPTKTRKLTVTFNSPAVLTFAAICFIATLLGFLTGGSINRLLFSTYRASLGDLLTYPRFFLHVFGHKDWNHLFNNLMYLLILGPMIEEKYGTRSTIILMAATALITGLLNTIFFPYTSLLGASGIVFAMILLSSVTGLKEHSIPLTLILVAALYLGQQLYNAFSVQNNISYMSHIVGGIVGAGAGFLMNRKAKTNR